MTGLTVGLVTWLPFAAALGYLALVARLLRRLGSCPGASGPWPRLSDPDRLADAA